MGRSYYDRKHTVEESTEMCIFRLKNMGLLEGFQCTSLTWSQKFNNSKSSLVLIADMICEQPYVRLLYKITRYKDGSEKDYDYKIYLAKTQCNFGGFRYWFICPHCGKRAGKLYRKPLGEVYHCRNCNDLTYNSRNDPRIWRPGGLCYLLKTEKWIKEIFANAKRRTWRGKPTRKMRRIEELRRKGQAITLYPEWWKSSFRLD